jgi:nucleoside 2-deoxyribosyltransferase
MQARVFAERGEKSMLALGGRFGRTGEWSPYLNSALAFYPQIGGAAGGTRSYVKAVKIYLAGPLFTTAEQEFNRQLSSALQDAGHEVWLAQEREPRDRSAKAIFAEDVAGLDWAEVVVANMEGPDPDSGTCWECGYAFRRKPVVLFRSDFRRAGDAGDSPFNLMLSESAAAVVLAPLASPRELAAKIGEQLRRVMPGK